MPLVQGHTLVGLDHWGLNSEFLSIAQRMASKALGMRRCFIGKREVGI